MGETSEQAPIARGSLAETPFGHLVIYLYGRTASGTLVLTTVDGAEATIGFQQGRPIRARFSTPAQGLLDGLVPLCGLKAGDFSFFEGDLLESADDAIAGVIDPYTLLAASLREHAREDMVQAVLDRYRGLKLRLMPGRDLERLGLTADDRKLIELIRAAPATAEELVQQSPLAAEQVRHLLYALIVTHMISLHEERSDETFRSQVDLRSGRPASGQSQGHEAASLGMPAWQQLASLRPGVPISTRPALKASVLPRASAGKADISASPPASMSPRSMSPRSMTPPAFSWAPESDDRASRLRKAEQLVQRGRCDDALALVDALLLDEPKHADLWALRGYVLFEKHRTEPDGLPRGVVDALKKALEIDPDQARALYTRGLVYKRAGDTKKAVASFRRVLQIDPKHIEARREVRLDKLRRS
jgi:tetratricopeptide (TPR) repeat protein